MTSSAVAIRSILAPMFCIMIAQRKRPAFCNAGRVLLTNVD
jgi:hypothetical protein